MCLKKRIVKTVLLVSKTIEEFIMFILCFNLNGNAICLMDGIEDNSNQDRVYHLLVQFLHVRIFMAYIRVL